MNRILIIEDEPDLLDSMVASLEPLGFHCEKALNFRSAIEKMDQFEYDCMVVDLNLPDGDGIEVIKAVRENRSTSGIIIVSARNALDERIRGLAAGADDYLVKPFHLSELIARVQSIIRRIRFNGDTRIQFRQMEIDPDQKIARYQGKEIEFTRKEMDIFLYLISNKNRVITREAMAEHIWGDEIYDMGGFDSMYTHIKNLRKKIQQSTGEEWLETVYGVGYKLADPS